MAILSGGQSTRIRLERPQLREPEESGDDALELEVAMVLVLGHVFRCLLEHSLSEHLMCRAFAYPNFMY